MYKSLIINYQELDSAEYLTAADRELLNRAAGATESAYAPYSRFRVGAALRLKDGTIVWGSNQENAAYPSGLCAERTAIFSASAQRPEMRDYDAIAIVGRNADGVLCEASPCGACRQVLLEYEQLQGHPIKVICYQPAGKVRVFSSVSDLLPMSFELSGN